MSRFLIFWLMQNVTVLLFPPPSISVKFSDVLVAAECDGFSVPILKDKFAGLTWFQER